MRRIITLASSRTLRLCGTLSVARAWELHAGCQCHCDRSQLASHAGCTKNAKTTSLLDRRPVGMVAPCEVRLAHRVHAPCIVKCHPCPLSLRHATVPRGPRRELLRWESNAVAGSKAAAALFLGGAGFMLNAPGPRHMRRGLHSTSRGPLQLPGRLQGRTTGGDQSLY